MDIRVATKLIQDKVHQIVRLRKAAEVNSDKAALPASTTAQSVQPSVSQTSQAPSVSQAQSQHAVSNGQPSLPFTTSASTPTLQSLMSTNEGASLSTDSGIVMKAESSTHTTDAEAGIIFGVPQVATAATHQSTNQVLTDAPNNNPGSQAHLAGSSQSLAAGSHASSHFSTPALSGPALPAAAAASSKQHLATHTDQQRETALPSAGSTDTATSEGSNHSSTTSANTHASEVCSSPCSASLSPWPSYPILGRCIADLGRIGMFRLGLPALILLHQPTRLKSS